MKNNSITYLKGRAFCLFFIVIFHGCKTSVEEHKLEGDALGTTYHISYFGEEIDHLKADIDSILIGFNHALSTYQSNSLVSAFNSNSNELWQDPENAKYFYDDMQYFMKMMVMSHEVWEKTNGAFDPSAAILFELYNKAKKERLVMDSIEVYTALLHTGLNKIIPSPNGFPMKKDSLVQVNFNAIAKGYLVDVIAEFISSKGIESFLVEVGGEVRCGEVKPNNEKWKLGINKPTVNAKPSEIFEVIELNNQAMATSGNYQNFYYIKDSLVGHTLDPRTGFPILSDLKSATIIHNSCAIADAYATACMVLGYNEAQKLIKSDSSLTGYFIREENGELIGSFVK